MPTGGATGFATPHDAPLTLANPSDPMGACLASQLSSSLEFLAASGTHTGPTVGAQVVNTAPNVAVENGGVGVHSSKCVRHERKHSTGSGDSGSGSASAGSNRAARSNSATQRAGAQHHRNSTGSSPVAIVVTSHDTPSDGSVVVDSTQLLRAPGSPGGSAQNNMRASPSNNNGGGGASASAYSSATTPLFAPQGSFRAQLSGETDNAGLPQLNSSKRVSHAHHAPSTRAGSLKQTGRSMSMPMGSTSTGTHVTADISALSAVDSPSAAAVSPFTASMSMGAHHHHHHHDFMGVLNTPTTNSNNTNAAAQVYLEDLFLMSSSHAAVVAGAQYHQHHQQLVSAHNSVDPPLARSMWSPPGTPLALSCGNSSRDSFTTLATASDDSLAGVLCFFSCLVFVSTSSRTCFVVSCLVCMPTRSHVCFVALMFRVCVDSLACAVRSLCLVYMCVCVCARWIAGKGKEETHIIGSSAV